MKHALWALAAGILAAATGIAYAGEVGFIEDFAIRDREAALKQLIPGTEDYYYFRCLNFQNTAQLDKIDAELKLWVERHGRTARVIEIENRQALLKYDKDPAGTLAFLRDRLGLTFSHQREMLEQAARLPTKLDPATISFEALSKRAFAMHPNSLDGFEITAIDALLDTKFSGEQRRSLLAKLPRPDYPGLVKLVADDLAWDHSGGFGSLQVHSRMLLAQLDDLLKLRPTLLNESNFVNAYIARLRPGEDTDLQRDLKARAAYLDRVWEFVSRLGPVHNSLKAHVLYQRLTLDRSQGVYDKDRFMTYVRLPRATVYVNPKYLELSERRDHMVNLSADFRMVTLLPPIMTDEPLVRSYLEQFFVKEEDYDAYKEFILDTYLKAVFAETKILNGIGDQEKWASLLSPEQFKALKDRVDIDFAFTNPQWNGPDDVVSLDVFVKNVQTLYVKVYQVNTINFYQKTLQPIDTTINLDGLVPNLEQQVDYKEAPLLKVKRSFKFDQLKARGVYVIDFIGNGKASRAVVTKGQLHHLSQVGPAGVELVVLDESRKKVANASVYIGEHVFAAGEDGIVRIPFSTEPGSKPLVLAVGDFASLDRFNHPAESYNLRAAFHVEREALIKNNRKATLVVRPRMDLTGTPLPIGLLEQPVLRIDSRDREGISTSKEVADLKLTDAREFTYEFQVPENLAEITFTLKGQIKSLVTGKKVDLAASKGFALNSIDTTEKVDDLFFSASAGKFSIDVLDKTGIVRPNRPVHLALKHRDFTDPQTVTLQSDLKGRVDLGDLAGIRTVTASSQDGVSHTWTLPLDWHNMQSEIHARTGDSVLVPYMGTQKEATPVAFSLLETRDGGGGPASAVFVKDWYSAIKLANGFLQITGLPPGDYSLLLKETQQFYTIKVTQADAVIAFAPASMPATAPASGPAAANRTASAGGAKDTPSLPFGVQPAGGTDYMLGASRYLESVNPAPLQIERIEADKDNVRIILRNATRDTRVHLAAVVFLPEYGLYNDLVYGGEMPSTVLPGRTDAAYVAGRDIGDEYRYILERKFAVKFPGNMLKRPELLLNPWAIRKTETGVLSVQGGGNYGQAGGGKDGAMKKLQELQSNQPAMVQGNVTSNYDFLPQPAMLLTNLIPDKDGVVVVPRKAVGSHQQFHVLAVDEQNTAYRQMAIEDQPMEFNDLRLLKAALNPAKDFAEVKQITLLFKDNTLTIEEMSSSKLEVYDRLAKAYSLYSTLSNNPTLAEFSFILQWPKLTDVQKRDYYSRYACHELNFFIFKKDPGFFEKVVGPYLKNKKDKTFLDRFLTGEDLSMYMKPWAHGRLNTVEQILLAQRIKDEAAKTALFVKERYDLIPPDVERFNFLFRTALKAGALETSSPDVAGVAFDADMPAKPATAAARMPGGLTAGDHGRGGGGGGPGVATGAPAPAAPPSPDGAPAALLKAQAEVLRAEKADEAKEELQKDMKKRDALVDREADKLGGEGEGKRKALDSAKGARERAKQEQLYRKVDKTEEFVENNYYHLPIEAQNADLVKVNGFWKDFAAADGKAPFVTANLAEAGGTFTEMMFALSVLDLPFEAGKGEPKIDGPKLTWTADGPTVVYHKEIKPVPPLAGQPSVLVNQNFFRRDDRYTFVDNEKVDKYVADEFLTHVVYGCQVVVTNPTQARQKLDVLIQIPAGAMPVCNSLYTRSVSIQMEPFSTQTVEYYFYFPSVADPKNAEATFTNYPVHVTKNQTLVAKPVVPIVAMKVVAKPTKLDTTSWDYISQHGTPEQVLAYLKDNNLLRVNLDKIAWRMQDAEFFKTVTGLLQDRHVYSGTLWSYGIKHNVPAVIREYLRYCDPFVAQCGWYIDSPLLTIDPVERRTYQHMEYAPLVNARAHKLGKNWQIANQRFLEQYTRLMKVLSYRPSLDSDDLMSVTYYMLLQDRVEEAFGYFGKVDAKKLATALQYDYFTAYLDFYKDKPTIARTIADKYKDHGVDRWRNLFASVGSQLDELEGKGGKVLDPENRDQTQGQLAAGSVGLDFTVEAKQVKLTYQNVKKVRVNYYLMDLELLFSRNPFVQQYSQDLFSYIQPNLTEEVALPEGKAHAFDIPAKFQTSNVMIEIVAGGVRRSQAYFSHSMAVQVIENYGQVKVTDPKQTALPKVYVKVYARMKDGTVQFYKDGYTDLRGRFDYSSLSTNQQDNVAKFSLLILSDAHGAMVREAEAPKQ